MFSVRSCDAALETFRAQCLITTITSILVNFAESFTFMFPSLQRCFNKASVEDKTQKT